MTSFLQHCYFVLECLQLCWCRRFDIQSFDGDWAVPVSYKIESSAKEIHSKNPPHLCTPFRMIQNRFSAPLKSHLHQYSNLHPSEFVREATKFCCSHRPISLAVSASHASEYLSAMPELNGNTHSMFAMALDTLHSPKSFGRCRLVALKRC